MDSLSFSSSMWCILCEKDGYRGIGLYLNFRSSPCVSSPYKCYRLKLLRVTFGFPSFLLVSYESGCSSSSKRLKGLNWSCCSLLKLIVRKSTTYSRSIRLFSSRIWKSPCFLTLDQIFLRKSEARERVLTYNPLLIMEFFSIDFKIIEDVLSRAESKEDIFDLFLNCCRLQNEISQFSLEASHPVLKNLAEKFKIAENS